MANKVFDLIDTETYHAPPTVRRRAFLSGFHAFRFAFGVKPRAAKPQAKYVEKRQRVGSKSRSSGRTKLTGTVSLKERKKRLAAKLRAAGCRTVVGYFAKKKSGT